MITAHTRPALPTHLLTPGPAQERTKDDSEEEDDDKGDDDVQRTVAGFI